MDATTYKCYYIWCDKSFNSKYNLKRHINALHLGIKRFECNMCGKKLVSKQNLSEHLYTHTGAKPFKCNFPGCEKVYRQSSQLSYHKSRVHMNTHKKGKSSEVSFQFPGEISDIALPIISLERKNNQLQAKLQVHHLLLR
ncbi:unnamed protein product [Blepharisma stoltei]|uniref:C2H2-type domain-containing protein n=1 Tax=Blepharisma stoltei TaxID=1481888 RepID=A0AAU9JH54_9CILI|nr:unnamed protein product [Blepharisma stoltei]